MFAMALATLTASATAAVGQSPQSAVTHSPAPLSERDHVAESRKHRGDGTIRARGFVRNDGGGLTAIGVPRAVATVASCTSERGQTVGSYVDARGRLHGLLRDEGRFIIIDFPGAESTSARRINAHGQIIGAWSEDPNASHLDQRHGFLLDRGAFTPIDVPGAVETQPHGINNLGQIVGAYVDAEGRTHGFLLDNDDFTTFDAPDGTATAALDIDDSGRIVGTTLARVGGAPLVRGFLRNAQGGFTPIDAPDTTQTQVTSINSVGQIVGFYSDGEDHTRGFVMDGSAFTTIDVTDPRRSTLILDINDRGQMTGANDVVFHGYFRDRRGNLTTIDHPDALGETTVEGINTRGQLVGRYVDHSGTTHGFLRGQRGFITIDVPGAMGTDAVKINDAGQVVGSYSLTDADAVAPASGFFWDRGVFTTFDVPGATSTNAADIDHSGQIVGGYVDTAGVSHGFVRDPSGTFTTVDVPGATFTLISGNNDRGEMVGFYMDAAGTFHGFLRDPAGAFTTIDAPASALTLPTGINNRGEIVGAQADDVRIRGFVLRDGAFTTLTHPATVIESFPFDIDDQGRIVGFYL
jgi:probable HAF family extracellular repeat protein